MADYEYVRNTVQNYFETFGLEVSAFNIGWYNDAVSKKFKLQYDRNTLAFVVISTPSMFEKAFLPYIKEQNAVRLGKQIDGAVVTNGHSTIDDHCSKDPLDACLHHHFSTAKSLFQGQDVEILQDFEILPNKRPKILVQTAAHVAGAAYYYQKQDVERLHETGCPLRNSIETNWEDTEAEAELNSASCKRNHAAEKVVSVANASKSPTVASNGHSTDVVNIHNEAHDSGTKVPRQSLSYETLPHCYGKHETVSQSSSKTVKGLDLMSFGDTFRDDKSQQSLIAVPFKSHNGIGSEAREVVGECSDQSDEREAVGSVISGFKLDIVAASSGCKTNVTQEQAVGHNLQMKTCTCAEPWDPTKRIYGVCVHPKYGGWFAIRGVLIFPNLQEELQQRDPVDCCNTRSLCINLLKRFNGNWQDWSYRDVIPVIERYSELQKEYFATLPKNRHHLLEKLLNS